MRYVGAVDLRSAPHDAHVMICLEDGPDGPETVILTRYQFMDLLREVSTDPCRDLGVVR